jgi:hypothetical protein
MGLFGNKLIVTCRVRVALDVGQQGRERLTGEVKRAFLLKLLRFMGIPTSMIGPFIKGAPKR